MNYGSNYKRHRPPPPWHLDSKADGVSWLISGTPEARATVDAVLAAGHNPSMPRDTPAWPAPSQAAIEADTRSAGQHHDGLPAARDLLCSGGWANTTGYPRPSSCPVAELQSRAGHALTAARHPAAHEAT